MDREKTRFRPGRARFLAIPCNHGVLKDLAEIGGKWARTGRASAEFERTYALATVFHGGSMANKGLRRISGAFCRTLTRCAGLHGGSVAMIELTNINEPH